MSEVQEGFPSNRAGYALKRSAGGRGLLLGGVPGVVPARVVVIGGGVVGTHAARMAVGLGAEVSNPPPGPIAPELRELDETVRGAGPHALLDDRGIEQEVFRSRCRDPALFSGPRARRTELVTREDAEVDAAGSVIVEVAIDQGGCFETSHATTHADPTYVVDGIIHYCVANMPGAGSAYVEHALTTRHCVRPGDSEPWLWAVKQNPHLLAV